MIFQTLLLSIVAITPLEVDPALSSLNGTFEQSTFMPGTIIGNWEEVDNPEGTRTLPGVWGGSGNNLISCELTPALGGPFGSTCVGGLSIEPDFTALTLTVEDLELAAFTGGPSAFPVTLGMLYETFRSVQPTSLYPGGIEVDFPLGEGNVTALRFEQVGSVQTEMEQTSEQAWSFVIDVPVLITMELEVLETPSGPLMSPGVLQLAGTLTRNGTTYQFTASSSFASEEVVEDIPIVFENVPLEVPTIIPPGEIAHLLLSAEAESATLTTKVNLQFTAEGGVTVPGDVDGDGVVSVADVLAIIAAWGPCDGCTEDLNNDGNVDVNDLLEVIANWSGS